MIKRTLFYWSKMFLKQIVKGNFNNHSDGEVTHIAEMDKDIQRSKDIYFGFSL